MRLLHSILSIGLVGLAVASTGSCNINDYCLDCEENPGVLDANTGSGDAADADLSDGGVFADACISSGIEQCDGEDNDCDGMIDEGTLPTVGDACGTSVGECEEGTTICQDGELICDGGVTPDFESCNNLDDDCDNMVDENNPQGGLICGSNVGECEAGVQLCSGGSLSCEGEVTGGGETCNGLDDDCDGLFDEGITTAGNCGPVSDQGICVFGTNTCIGGSMQCVGATHPELEQCDAIDHDCDGNNTNGFDLQGDAQNCGMCGNVCSAPNAFMSCTGGACTIAACQPGFFNLTPSIIDGCEYACNFQGGETCNGQDDDCDGLTDEGVDAFAPLCDQDGACSTADATATCNSTLGRYECNYDASVTVDGNGDIIPETDCDEIDNDCDGNTDEAFVNKGAVCDDGEIGLCRDAGTFICNATDDGVECSVVDDEADPPASAEICNNEDDDCDGNVDETDVGAGADPREWVDIGGGVEIMKYEASRPDSTSVDQGFVIDASVCSEAGRQPWTNITQPEAEAACARIGATLCDESVWQTACETDNLNPLSETGTEGLMMIEVEDMTHISGDTHDWVAATGLPGFSGTSIRFLSPDNGGNDAGSLADAARLDQSFSFTSAGDKYVWVRTFADQTFDDEFFVSFDNNTGAAVSLAAPVLDSWEWVRTSAFNLSAGNHTVNIYGGDGGVIVDRVIITSDVNFVPLNQGPPEQCQWSYSTDCRTYQPDSCNGEDFDGIAGGNDDDIMLATGSMNACFAEWEAGGDAFDLSGNVKEWTSERAAGVNPIRGGSFNNSEIGISCQFDFLTADDAFFLPNIGFRCCR
jgi:hypothetical protein